MAWTSKRSLGSLLRVCRKDSASLLPAEPHGLARQACLGGNAALIGAASAGRRAVLAGLGVTVLAALSPGSAQARAGAIRGIIVDVGPLQARGLGAFAERVRASLARDLAREFARRLVPSDRNAPNLVVVVHSVSLNAFAGPSGMRGGGQGGDPSSDFLEATIGLGRPTQPLLVSQPANGGGARFGVLANEAQRVDALTRATAHWTRRRLVV